MNVACSSPPPFFCTTNRNKNVALKKFIKHYFISFLLHLSILYATHSLCISPFLFFFLLFNLLFTLNSCKIFFSQKTEDHELFNERRLYFYTNESIVLQLCFNYSFLTAITKNISRSSRIRDLWISLLALWLYISFKFCFSN